MHTLLFIGCFILCSVLIFLLKKRNRVQSSISLSPGEKLPPEVKEDNYPIFRHLFSFYDNNSNFLHNARDKLGTVFTFTLWKNNVTFLMDIKLLKYYYLSGVSSPIQPFFGPLSYLLGDDNVEKLASGVTKNNNTMDPLMSSWHSIFHTLLTTNLHYLVEDSLKSVNDIILSKVKSVPLVHFDPLPLIHHAIVYLAAEYTFGKDILDKYPNLVDLYKKVELSLSIYGHPFKRPFIRLTHPDLVKGKNEFFILVKDIIKNEKHLSKKNTLFDLLISKTSSVDTMSDSISCLLAFFMLTSTFNVSYLTFWIFSYLISGKYPESSEKVMTELLSGNGDWEHLNSTKILDSWIKEMIRLKLSPIGFRQVTKDIPLKEKNILIPAGNLLGVSTYITHFNQEFWKNPGEFLPEQRIQEALLLNPEEKKYAFVGFGADTRKCPGERLGCLEVKLLLYALFKNFKFIPEGPVPMSQWEGFPGIIHPQSKFLVTVQPTQG